MEIPLLDGTDAMVVTIVATEAMVSLSWHDLTPDQARGVVLLFDAIMQTVTPLLPRFDSPEMAHVKQAMARAHQLADAIKGVQ